jgi:hypothetical protein
VSRPTLSERIERSSAGQLVVSVVIVLLLLAEVGTHLPPSAIRERVADPANEIIRILASEQSWGVFAPNPRGTSLKLEGRIYFRDGTMETWTLPEGPRIGGNFRYYRWRKWLERVRDDSYSSLWAPTAEWLADIHDDPDVPVVRVELVRLFRENSIEGPQPPYQEFVYYTLDVTQTGS